MDTLKKLFPLSFREKKEVKDFIIVLVIYAVISIVCEIVFWLLGKIPLVGFLFGLVGWVVGLYIIGGVVLTILHFTGVIKD